MYPGPKGYAQRGMNAGEGVRSATTAAEDHVAHEPREHDHSQRPNRPGTALRTYGDQKHSKYAYGTDAESLDPTSPPEDAVDVAPNAHRVQSDYGDDDDDHAAFDEIDDLSEQQTSSNHFNNGGRDARLEELPDSYPSTTSGEPEVENEPETHHEKGQPSYGQREDHPDNVLQWRQGQVPAFPPTRPSKTVSLAQPIAVVRGRPGAHRPPPEVPIANSTDVLKPPPVHTQVLRQQPTIQASDARKQFNPRDYHVQQQTATAILEQHQDHLGASEAHGFQGDELDYDLEELYMKDFASLQNDPFDGPLLAKPEAVSAQSAPQSLEQKLAATAQQDSDSQKNFFAALNIDEWDEAGDWFQDRFSDILNKLRRARKQKRELARKFEDEISQRQQRLVRKRTITDAALEEMKMSGAAVLQNTPKKKQKFTR